MNMYTVFLQLAHLASFISMKMDAKCLRMKGLGSLGFPVHLGFHDFAFSKHHFQAGLWIGAARVWWIKCSQKASNYNNCK
jgi:hypothetical protein